MDIIPAIDILGGRCVRLTQGDYGRKKEYSSDPVEVARTFEQAGAKRLHLVDLDGARSAAPQNLDVLRSIVSATSLVVEFGGGIKSEASLEAVLEAGARYAICGSIAVTAPDTFSAWLDQYGDRIILGVDVRGGLVATHGWLKTSRLTAVDAISSWRDRVKQVIVTEIDRDGMLRGVNLEFYAGLQQQFPGQDIVVSGGIGTIEQLAELKAAGIRAVIVGKALYEGRIKLESLF
ncbi:MAG: 1-(5-phosphoribosyl)-5-[(5-phosphoribosylamino)methylideneamino]imidazole-4-carboxamide isomerase [Bacteroidales bacterium]|jgi:phosphoribosylformimino-5-aminoimidazole carboxamide ribotide isomerase|nr:1-(5-phosphoribosyl)-5-[(5-phosphoribosylamino)methylideneamino]imidazole-4-carboxamide isomerase [Bacteroidota bacterium]NLN99781.1 1-(5-phosphoribosyl)-5-[(5-phosphoribosylamino)methylideneamino]imidazole-4-carboxamide isomerase [Bacteroidales bacterium]